MTDLFDIREKFLANPYTIRNVQQDFQAWRQGRRRYAFWAIDVDVPSVKAQVSIAKQDLEPFLLPEYSRQPHITLGISGFLSGRVHHADDYAADNFEADLTALKSLQLKPFMIEIGTLASFGSAPFLHVRDSGQQLGLLHRCLHRVAADADFQYVPHVTVGLYAQAWSTASVSKILDAYTQHAATQHFVTSVSLMSYMAAEIGGALIKVADYDLMRATVEWHEPALFDLD